MQETNDLPPGLRRDAGEGTLVTGADLAQILESKKFALALTLAVGLTRKSDADAEIGFRIMRHTDTGETMIIHDTVSGVDSISIGSKGNKKLHHAMDRGFYEIAGLHTHGITRGATIRRYAPSRDDLLDLSASRETARFSHRMETNPVGIIALNRGPGMTDLVLFQQTALANTSDTLLEQYMQDIRTNITIPDVIGLLENYGYKAAMIPYTKKGLSEIARNKLEKFSSTTMKISQEASDAALDAS